jgi:hypothetical protein
MDKAMKEKIKKEKSKDSKVGEGFSDARGYIPEGPIAKNNGLNINNEPRGAEQREEEKQKRR